MLSTKKYIFLILICFSFEVSSSQLTTIDSATFIQLPYLSKTLCIKIADKTEEEICCGYMRWVNYTNGELEFEKILADSVLLNKENKFELCFSILIKYNLYHLHDRAGMEIHKSLNDIDLKKWVLKIPENKQGYVLHKIIKIQYPLSKTTFSIGQFMGLDSANQNEIFKILQIDYYGLNVKKYFIEALYSMAEDYSTGFIIHEKLNTITLSDNLKKYNDSLYTIYQIFKPLFANLKTIHTWKEMDQVYSSIKEVFTNSHPIMFLEILTFNPSMMLESDELCILKQKILSEILTKTEPESFYFSYRFIYLNELLFDRNYSVRFLDRVMNKEEKEEFIVSLSK